MSDEGAATRYTSFEDCTDRWKDKHQPNDTRNLQQHHQAVCPRTSSRKDEEYGAIAGRVGGSPWYGTTWEELCTGMLGITRSTTLSHRTRHSWWNDMFPCFMSSLSISSVDDGYPRSSPRPFTGPLSETLCVGHSVRLEYSSECKREHDTTRLVAIMFHYSCRVLGFTFLYKRPGALF